MVANRWVDEKAANIRMHRVIEWQIDLIAENTLTFCWKRKQKQNQIVDKDGNKQSNQSTHMSLQM